MNRLRFTISGLMGVVLVAAIGFASLRFPTKLWDSALFTAALLILGGATMAAFLFRERYRAKWAGFATFGIAYLILTTGPWSETMRTRLVTTNALHWLDAKLAPKSSLQIGTFTISKFSGATTLRGMGAAAYNRGAAASQPPASGESLSGTPLLFQTQPAPANTIVFVTTSSDDLELNRDYFQPIGHSLFTILAAITGGMMGGWLHAIALRRRDETLHDRPARTESLSLSPTAEKIADSSTEQTL